MSAIAPNTTTAPRPKRRTASVMAGCSALQPRTEATGTPNRTDATRAPAFTREIARATRLHEVVAASL